MVDSVNFSFFGSTWAAKSKIGLNLFPKILKTFSSVSECRINWSIKFCPSKNITGDATSGLFIFHRNIAWWILPLGKRRSCSFLINKTIRLQFEAFHPSGDQTKDLSKNRKVLKTILEWLAIDSWGRLLVK